MAILNHLRCSTMVTSSRHQLLGSCIGIWGGFGAWNSICWTLQDAWDFGNSWVEVLVYGASVIHHSKRPLLQNYYNFTHIDDERHVTWPLLGRTEDPESHYSIFEDNHGTHIFANNDLDLMTKLTELWAWLLPLETLKGLHTRSELCWDC